MQSFNTGSLRLLYSCFGCKWITKLQKRIVRILSISKYNAQTEPIFKILSLLKINDILKLWELKFHYKYKNNLLPRYLQNVLFKVILLLS